MNDIESEEGEEVIFEVTKEDRENFKRLDQFLVDKIPQCSRTFLKNLFDANQIQLEKEAGLQKLELKKMPAIGSKIIVHIPPPLPASALPENIPLDILFEDEHLIFINKAPGMVTHPAPGNYTGTLVNAILYHCRDLTGVGDQKRPGIVHRLDKGTSGIMVVAKTQASHEGLVLLFSKHAIERYYEAIVTSSMTSIPLESYGRVESTIGRDPHNRLKMKAFVQQGKNAITHYKLIKNFGLQSHLEFKLETGRTHQIRVHSTDVLKRPLLCDSLYGNPHEQLLRVPPTIKELLKDYAHPLLHAKILGFIHPITKETLHFEVPPPKIFSETLKLYHSL